MTTRSWLLISGACLLTGAAAGRYTARTPNVTQQEAARETIAESTTQEAASAVEATSAAQETQSATVTQATDRMHIIAREKETRPDGSTHERSLEVDAESSRLAMELQASRVETAAMRAELAEARAAVRVETRAEERRVEVRTPLPDWRVGGLVGLSLRGGPEPAYGVELQRRVWGPVYLGLGVLNNGTAFAHGGWEF